MENEPAPETIHELHARWGWLPADQWDDNLTGHSAGLAIFKRQFHLKAIPPSAVIRLSADTRYKLLINERRAAVGPSRGSDRIWYYDTIDVVPYLRNGANTLVIHVLRYFPGVWGGFSFARTRSPGLTIWGKVGDIDVSLDEEWSCAKASNVGYPFPARLDSLINNFEEVQPEGNLTWTRPKFYNFPLANGSIPPWNLSPRMIPFPSQEALSVHAVRHVKSDVGLDIWENWLLHDKAITLSARTVHRIEIEFPCHSTAYISLALHSTAPGTEVRLTYSEAYEKGVELEERLKGAPPIKGDRTARTDGQILLGPSDLYRVTGGDGQQVETYEPFWWRCFRFIVLDIQVGPTGLALSRFTTTQTNYPLERRKLRCSDAEVKLFYEVSWRTLRNCIYDGYADCPFYEQLQYASDSRLESLFHYYATGDDRLARQCITAFAASVLPGGFIQSRSPAHGIQSIIGFNLFWCNQVYDHMQFFGDAAFSRQFLPIIDGILEFFGRHIGPLGIVEGFSTLHWAFIDWHPEWTGEDGGYPMSGRGDRRWTYYSMLYSWTLQNIAKLCIQLGRDGIAQEYTRRSVEINGAVRLHCFDGRYFADSSTDEEPRTYSQHCQVMAILSGVSADPDEQKRILSASLEQCQDDDHNSSPSFAKCSYHLQHYVFRALSMTGLYDKCYNAMWDPWRRMLDNNLSTWAEDDCTERSDCHAWSSLPLFELPAEVAGLSPLLPGWKRIQFRPRIHLYDEFELEVALGSLGLAHVSWMKNGTGGKRVSLMLPCCTSVVVISDQYQEEWRDVNRVQFSI